MPQLEHDFEGTPLFICVKRHCHRIFDADKEKEKLIMSLIYFLFKTGGIYQND